MPGYGCLCEWDEDGNPVGEHGPLCFKKMEGPVMWNTCAPCRDRYHDYCTKRVLVVAHEPSVPCDCKEMGHTL